MVDLEAMRRSPGSVSKRDLVAALREHGWELERDRGDHEFWTKAGYRPISVPHTLKGTGTIRGIVGQIIEGRTTA